ncbi:hypothetical protein ACQPZJ_23015 [Actinoplanes sp. CA-054009]
MISRRVARWAFASAACLLLSACTAPATAPPAASPSAAPFDAGAALAASTGGIDAGGYTFSIVGPRFETSGGVHPPSGSAEILSTVQQSDLNVLTRARVAGGRTFLLWRLTGGKWDELDRNLETAERSPDRGVRERARTMRHFRGFFDGTYWMPPAALPASAAPQVDLRDPDVVGVKRLLDRVVSAQGDDLVITGTLDSSGLAQDRTLIGSLARMYPPRTGTAMPFRATLDAEDRIASLSLTTPGSGDSWVISLSGYGTTPPQVAPPADIVKMPSPQVLKLLRGADLSKPV